MGRMEKAPRPSEERSLDGRMRTATATGPRSGSPAARRGEEGRIATANGGWRCTVGEIKGEERSSPLLWWFLVTGSGEC